MRPEFLLLAAAAALAALAGCAGTGGHPAIHPLAAGVRYVAMGSSFAAGPGVTVSADQPRNRCSRSAGNYAHQLAQKRGLLLTDVSCGGATTAHLFGSWGELAPQLDAVTADTRLVTVTIGGNDVGYIGGLSAASCQGRPGCPVVPPPGEQAWQLLETAMRRIAGEVRRRAPEARLIFVDYLTILPEHGVCAATPVSREQAETSRAVARRLAAITARIADESGVEVLRNSALSRRHDACSRTPWTNGFPSREVRINGAPYHPNLAGMTAIAEALDRMLTR